VRALAGDFDEVRFVRLGDVDDSGLMTATIAAAMGVLVERTQSALDAVAEAVGEDRLLVGLDNLEQLVDVGPDLAELLDRCPDLHLLVTSRHVLRLRGEREYPLAPLEVPAPSIFESSDAIARVAAEPAVELFVEHAQAARPTFRLDSSNARAVTELVRRLDGLPLAIELVATRIRLFPPEDLLERFGNQLLLLTSGSTDLPDRHRTLHATLDWSHRLLDPHEQSLFARLAVFSGGAPLDAVEEVCGVDVDGDVLETLASLLEKSLVVTVDDAVGGPRVAMLQTVRSYAWEHLESRGDLTATRARHATWCLSLAADCDPARRPDATARWGALDTELPNMRAAVAWLTEEDDTAALALIASSLWTWYWIRGRMSEGRTWIESLSPRIDSPDDDSDVVVAAQLCAAVGAVRFSLGDYDSAAGLFQRALEGFDSSEDTGGSAQVSCLLAVIEAVRGDPTDAIELAGHAVAKARSLEVPWSLAHALVVLGGLTRQAGSAEHGSALQLEALETIRRVGERVSEGQILGQIALAELSAGNIAGANTYFVEAFGCCRETRHMEGMAFCLEIGAVVSFAEGRPREAAVLVGAADAIRERLNIAVLPVMKAGRDGLLAALVEVLGAAENTLALTEGRRADPFALLASAIEGTASLSSEGRAT
jgi:predicted ATPase